MPPNSFLRTWALLASTALLFVGLAGPALFAATVTDTLTVTTTAVTNCTITVPDVDFGTYTGAEVHVNFQVVVDCPIIGVADTPVISANAGTNFAVTGCNRALVIGAATTGICYDLYKGAWNGTTFNAIGDDGATHPGASQMLGAGTSSATLDFHALAPASTGLSAGVHSDTVIWTVTF